MDDQFIPVSGFYSVKHMTTTVDSRSFHVHTCRRINRTERKSQKSRMGPVVVIPDDIFLLFHYNVTAVR